MTAASMSDWWRRSPEIGLREIAFAAVGGLMIAIVQFMPLVFQLSSHIPTDLGDPLSQAWQIAWGGHALVHQPLSFWQSNQFWPAKDTLAFSDALVGLAPFGMLGSGTAAAIRNYNLALLFSYSLAFTAVYLLAREMFEVPPWAAAVSGAAFAWSPWRLWQTGHMHVISSGGIALALFLLLRGYRRASTKLIVCGWLTAGWLCSIGFTLGIQLDYLLLALSVICGVAWWLSGRPKPPVNVVWATIAGIGGFVLIVWLVTRPYLRVMAEYPHVHRSLNAVINFSPGPLGLLTPPRQSLLWGDLTAGMRPAKRVQEVEGALYLGVFTLLLAGLGVTWQKIPKALRVGLGLAFAAFAILSLGIHNGAGRYMPYRFLYDYLPGWNTMRTPGRLQTLTTLALALLAAAGAGRAFAWVSARKGSTLATCALAGLTFLVLLDGSGIPYPQPEVPQPAAALASIKGPYLQLPVEASNNRRYLLWSTDRFPKMVNGRSSFTPPIYRKIVRASRGFPSAGAARRLRKLGVRKVVVHTDFHSMPLLHETGARGPTWHDAISVPTPPGSQRTLRRPLVIYSLG